MSHRMGRGSLSVMASVEVPSIEDAWAQYMDQSDDDSVSAFAGWFFDKYQVVLPVAYEESELADFVSENFAGEDVFSILDRLYQDWEPEIVDGPAGC